jgi:tetratricopeptide (TPR) repeat protein
MRSLLWLLIVIGGLTTAAMASEGPVDKAKLLDLLRKGDFEALEARLTGVQQQSEAGNGQDQWVGVAFDVFKYYDPEIQTRLDEWVRNRPGSYAARLARAVNQPGLGWNSRGGGFARDTSDEQFAEMHRHFANARTDLRAALEINERLGIAYALLINLASAESQREERLESLKAGLVAVPRSYHIRWMFLWSLRPEWGGSIEAMEEFADASVGPYPDDPALQALRGFADWVQGERLRRRGRYDEALNLFDQAMKHGPHWRYLKSRGATLERLGRSDEALEAYNQADGLRPQDADILQSRGWLHFMTGRFVEALEDYTLALDLDPYDPGKLTSRAMVLRDFKQKDLALADLDRALIRGSDKVRVRFTRGQLLLNHFQDAEAARDDLERATELAPKSARNWYTYMRALYALRDCQILTAIQKFQAICDSSGNCRQDQLNWTRNTLTFISDQGICPN